MFVCMGCCLCVYHASERVSKSVLMYLLHVCCFVNASETNAASLFVRVGVWGCFSCAEVCVRLYICAAVCIEYMCKKSLLAYGKLISLHLAIQLAKLRGCFVATTCSTVNVEV